MVNSFFFIILIILLIIHKTKPPTLKCDIRSLRKWTKDQLLQPQPLETRILESKLLLKRAANDFGKNILGQACQYATQGGKHLRMIIVNEICRKATTTGVDASEVALAVEYIHAASLIIDDLPSFDNDTERRGEPSVHQKYGTRVAHMAAVALVAAAFHNICRQGHWIQNNRPWLLENNICAQLCYYTSKSIGAAAKGQLLDTISDPDSPKTTLKILQLKTAALFELAFVAGWIVSGGERGAVVEIQTAGRLFGTAYQLADDLQDVEKDASRQHHDKPGLNFTNRFGPILTKKLIRHLCHKSKKILIKNNLYSNIWTHIYTFINGNKR